MSKDSSNKQQLVQKKEPDVDSVAQSRVVPWNPWIAVIFVLLIYYLSQVVGALSISIYPWLKHWTSVESTNWLNNSVIAQFIYILIAEAFTVGAIFLFLRRHKVSFGIIGLHKPRWRDPLYGIIAAPIYYLLYVIAVVIISHFVPSLNINQQQQIGFNSVHGVAQLVLTFISLVILPPFTEEILVRGFLYGSLKKGMPQIAAALVASILFASAHLPEGGAAGPLYIAAVDTFILSLVLIYLREKTGSLWASMTLHAIKNGVAFVALFLVGTR